MNIQDVHFSQDSSRNEVGRRAVLRFLEESFSEEMNAHESRSLLKRHLGEVRVIATGKREDKSIQIETDVFTCCAAGRRDL